MGECLCSKKSAFDNRSSKWNLKTLGCGKQHQVEQSRPLPQPVDWCYRTTLFVLKRPKTLQKDVQLYYDEQTKAKLKCHVYFSGVPCILHFNNRLLRRLHFLQELNYNSCRQSKKCFSRKYTFNVIDHQISHKLNLYKACNWLKFKLLMYSVSRNRHSCGVNNHKDSQIHSQFSNRQSCLWPKFLLKYLMSGIGLTMIIC